MGYGESGMILYCQRTPRVEYETYGRIAPVGQENE